MPYAWGSDHLIQDLTGLGSEGEPAAELWFGSHPVSPSKLIGSEQSLQDLRPDLGFLVKFLAAAKPLSIQAHPTKARAKEQFALGNQSYADANHKPEMIIAVTEFEALCGFRPLEDIEADLEAVGTKHPVFAELRMAYQANGLEGAARYSLEHNLANELSEAITTLSRSRVQLFQNLSEHFPGDLGLVVAVLFMNHVRLAPGEALFLPAGNIHAYLKGLGVEVMASSDNVLRGGLTPKRIDIQELMQVLDFSPLPEPKVKVRELLTGLTQYPADVEDFSVYRVDVSAANMLIDLELKGDMIAVCTSGELEISTSTEEYQKLKRGQAAFVGDAKLFSMTGNGTGYLAMG